MIRLASATVTGFVFEEKWIYSLGGSVPAGLGLPVKPWGAAWQINIPQDAAVIFQKCEDIMKKRIPEAIMAKPDQFDAIWDTFMNELEKAGVHQMEGEFSKLLKNRIEQWNN